MPSYFTSFISIFVFYYFPFSGSEREFPAISLLESLNCFFAFAKKSSNLKPISPGKSYSLAHMICIATMPCSGITKLLSSLSVGVNNSASSPCPMVYPLGKYSLASSATSLLLPDVKNNCPSSSRSK